MLKEFAIITITVLNLNGIEPAYQDYLGYQAVERGQVSAELAELWKAPEMTGHDFLTLQPATDYTSN